MLHVWKGGLNCPPLEGVANLAIPTCSKELNEMTSDREFLERLRERQLAQIERMDGARKTYWRAPLIIALLAWALLLATTFLVAVGVVALWSGAHVFASAVFLIVGVMAGAMAAQSPAAQSPGAQRPGAQRQDREARL